MPFYQQGREGIIERIEVSPDKFSKYIWIPHRPVIKMDEQSTTKIRPVFNCSLKTRGSCSLNEASHPGIKLINDMLNLLLLFRTNKYVLLVIYCHLHVHAEIYIYMLDTYRRNEQQTQEDFFNNIYLSLYCKGSKRLCGVLL